MSYVVILDTGPETPVYHRGWARHTSDPEPGGAWKVYTACGRIQFEQRDGGLEWDHIEATLREEHAKLFSRPCRQCFKVSDEGEDGC